MCLIGLVVFCEVGIQLTFPYGYQIAPVGWFFCPFSWKCPFWVYLLKSFLKNAKYQALQIFLIYRAPQRHVSISVSFLCISPLPVSSIHKYPQRVLCSEPCMFLWEQRMWAWRRVWVHSDHVTMLSNPNIKSGWDFLSKVCVSSSWCLDMRNDVGGLGLGSLGPAVWRYIHSLLFHSIFLL